MADGKKSFILYADIIHTVKKLPRDKQADLFMTILEYVNDLNPEVNDIMVDLVFEPIKRQLKRDLQKFEDIKEARAESGRKGGLARAKKVKQSQAKPSNAKQTQANQADNVNDTVTVTDTVNETGLSTSFNKDASVRKVVDYWNKVRGNMPEVRILSDTRKRKIRKRLSDKDGAIILKRAIDIAAKDEFLQGGGGRGWRCNLDWILEPSNLIKVLETYGSNPDDERIQKLRETYLKGQV